METEEANLADLKAQKIDPANGQPDAHNAVCNYYKARAETMAKTRTVLENMRLDMSVRRRAPKLLGVLELNETLIESIRASIVTALTGFVFAFISGVMSDVQTTIGEASGFHPTGGPTFEPAWVPTWG